MTRVFILWHNTVMGFPIWALALVVAATSPMIVRYVADVMEARVKRRTEVVIAKLGLARGSKNGGVDA